MFLFFVVKKNFVLITEAYINYTKKNYKNVFHLPVLSVTLCIV